MAGVRKVFSNNQTSKQSSNLILAHQGGPWRGRQHTDTARAGHSHLGAFFHEELLYTVGLTKLDLVGPVLGRELLNYFGSAKAVFHCSQRELLSLPGIGPKTASSILKGRSLLGAERELKFAEKRGIKVLTILDPEYPEGLKEIYDAPLVIYTRGGYNFGSQPMISIVGTRMPSEYGRIVAQNFTEYFVDQGFCVVSGLAFGIDATVHRKVLERGGNTVAVLGHGFGTLYPQEHWREAQGICKTGALVTEFGSDVLPEARNFPMRNRIISGLSHATIVIEAGDKGGALITARSAFEQNRLVYAIPGDLTRSQAQGSNALIRDQIAKMVLHPSEVVDELEPSIGHLLETKISIPKPSVTVSQEELSILEILSGEPQRVTSLSKKAGSSMGRLRALLIRLEVEGLVRKEVGGIYYVTSIKGVTAA